MKLHYVFDGHNYEITFDDFKIFEGYFYANNIVMTMDDELVKDYGESFSRHKYDALGVLRSAIISYINNDESCTYIDVPIEIASLKSDFFVPKLTVNGHVYSEHYIIDGLKKFDCVIITDNAAGYVGDDGECILLSDKGHVMTDNEAFFKEAVLLFFRTREILFISPELEKSLNEYED